jgi:hypothetical protein
MVNEEPREGRSGALTWSRSFVQPSCRRHPSDGGTPQSACRSRYPIPRYPACQPGRGMQAREWRAHHRNDLSEVSADLQVPRLVKITVGRDDLCSCLGCSVPSERQHPLVAAPSRTGRDPPSFATRYLPRNPVAPNTVATCPLDECLRVHPSAPAPRASGVAQSKLSLTFLRDPWA